MLSRIDSHVQDYLGIKVEEPVPKEEKIVWPGNETPPGNKTPPDKKDEKSLWVSNNWNEVKSEKKQNPSLSPSLVSSHSLSPPTSGPSDNESDDSIPPAPSPTSLISGEDSNSPHFFEENTSKSPENKTKSPDNKSKSQANIYGHISKEGKQSTDEQRAVPIDWGTSTSPPPERPFAHLGSSTTPSSEINDKAAQIKKEPKSPEPSLSSTTPSLPNKEEVKKEDKETGKEIEVKKKSKGNSEPVVTDLLSDVSSAHTSDLSDFDDPMSISSVEEADALKSKTESSGDIEKPEKVEKMEIDEKIEEKIDKTEIMAKPEKSEKHEKTERTEKTEKVEKSTKVEKVEKNIKTEKPEIAEIAEKTEKMEKIERTSKPVKSEKIGDVQIKEENDSPLACDEPSQSKKKTTAQPAQPAQPVQSNQLVKPAKPEFEVIRSAPDAPVFDVRFQERPKGSVKELMATPKKSEDNDSEVKSMKAEKSSANVQKSNYVIPKIKKEPKGSRESSPATSRHNPEDSKSRKSQSSNKRK